MKNLIRVLLYLLLVLLVVAISVMMYKRFKTLTDMEPTTEMLDSMFVDTAISSQNLPMTAEDSVILGLTGELPNQVGITEPDNGSIDYSGNVNNSSASTPKENTSPVAKAVSNNGKAVKSSTTSSDDLPSVNLANSTKSESKSSTTAAKSTKVVESNKSTKTAAPAKSKEMAKSSSSATTSKSGKYYVVAGSFIVPSHAEKQVSKLKSLGYSTAAKKVFGNEEYYRAVAGQYDSREAADKTVKNLKAKGQAAFVKMQ